MKVFISQPMRSLSDEQILATREEAIKEIKERYREEEIEIIDSFFKDAPVDAKPLWYLADSLKLMSNADVVAFVDGYNTARGCNIEHICAKEYGYEIIYLQTKAYN